MSSWFHFFLSSTEEECLVSWCNNRLERENRSYLQMFENTVIVLCQFYEELTTFSSISTRDDGERFITSVSSSLETVTQSFQGNLLLKINCLIKIFVNGTAMDFCLYRNTYCRACDSLFDKNRRRTSIAGGYQKVKNH